MKKNASIGSKILYSHTALYCRSNTGHDIDSALDGTGRCKTYAEEQELLCLRASLTSCNLQLSDVRIKVMREPQLEILLQLKG